MVVVTVVAEVAAAVEVVVVVVLIVVEVYCKGLGGYTTEAALVLHQWYPTASTWSTSLTAQALATFFHEKVGEVCSTTLSYPPATITCHVSAISTHSCHTHSTIFVVSYKNYQKNHFSLVHFLTCFFLFVGLYTAICMRNTRRFSTSCTAWLQKTEHHHASFEEAWPWSWLCSKLYLIWLSYLSLLNVLR